MYGLGVLCTFLFLSQLRTNPKPWVLACILFLMAHTSIYGLLVSISLATQLPYVRSSKADANVTTVTEIAVVTVILISGWITSVLQMITPADGGYQPGWISHFEWERVIMAAGDIWKGYVPITPFTRTFWGYWQQDNIVNSQALKAMLSAILVFCGVLLFRRRKQALLLYTTGTLALFAFGYFKFVGYARHFGHYYLILLASLWVAGMDKGTGTDTQSDNAAVKLRGHVLTVLSIVHIFAVLHPLYMDWLYPFSAAKATAAYLDANGLSQSFIATDRDWSGIPVAGYLNRKLYSPRTGRTNSFVVKDKLWSQWRDWTDTEVIAQLRRVHAQHHSDIILLLDYPLNAPEHLTQETVLLWRSPVSLVPDESYFIYLMTIPSGGQTIQETL